MTIVGVTAKVSWLKRGCAWSKLVMDALITAAGNLLGYSSLKEEKRVAIREFLEGRDVFIVLPTGFGKTACFTCLPLAFDLSRSYP